MCHQGQEKDLAPPVQDHVRELDYDVLYSRAGAVSSVQCAVWVALSVRQGDEVHSNQRYILGEMARTSQ